MSELIESLKLFQIPEHMHEGITAYILTGRQPGNFLTALLSNDLRKAVAYADESNEAALVQWVKFLYNEAPLRCWGSPSAVVAWMDEFSEKRACARVAGE